MQWINTPTAAINMAQVCKIEFRYTDITNSDEVNGFDLYFADGNTLTVRADDCGFADINDVLEEDGFVLNIGGAV